MWKVLIMCVLLWKQYVLLCMCMCVIIMCVLVMTNRK